MLTLKLNGCSAIIDESEAAWMQFYKTNKQQAREMSKVMIGIFERTLSKGKVYDKYSDLGNINDGRGAYLAVRDAYHSSSSKVTAGLCKDKIKSMVWPNADGNFNPFLAEFKQTCASMDDLKDKNGNSIKLTQSQRVEYLEDIFKQSQRGLPVGEQFWSREFINAQRDADKSGDDFTVDDLANVITPILESQLQAGPAEGKVFQQTGRPSKVRDATHIICHKCLKKGHYADECRNKKAESQTVCWNFQKGSCNFGTNCVFKHETDTEYESFKEWKSKQPANGNSNQNKTTETHQGKQQAQVKFENVQDGYQHSGHTGVSPHDQYLIQLDQQAKSQGFNSTHWADGVMYPSKSRTGKSQKQLGTIVPLTIDNVDCSDDAQYNKLVKQTDAQFHKDEIAKFEQYHRTLNKAAASHGDGAGQ